jgi:hypothetical protein
MSNVLLNEHVILPKLLLSYKVDVHICQPRHTSMATRRKRFSSTSDAPATRKKMMEQQDPTNICTYWPAIPAFDPRQLLLRCLIFINVERTNTCLLVSTPQLTIYRWWNLGSLEEAVGPRPSSSAMNRWTLWQKAFPCYGTPCVVARHMLGFADARG